MSPSDERHSSPFFLPEISDLLRLMDEWRRLAGLSKADIGEEIGKHRSAVTRIFRDGRGLDYDEAEQILDYLSQRLSPLPKQEIKSLATPPKKLITAEAGGTIAEVVKKMKDGNFTQLPVFDSGKYLGLVTDRMIVERLLHPNLKNFKGTWIDKLRNMPVRDAAVIETSAIYEPEASISSVASALAHFYAVMIGENNKTPDRIVTRWDYLKLLRQIPSH
jgi:predicted transcriptional regulator